MSAAVFVLYLVTLAPSVATVFDDSLEFQVVGPSLGIAHPTGYPLYTLLAWLFSRLPLGDPAYRVNLLSAVAGAATVGLVFLLSRELGSSRPAAAIASLIFAVSSTWWSQATIAEVYTLHGFFVALILLLALQGQRDRPAWLWLALTCGLSLTHHRMTLLLFPGLLVFVLWSDPGLLRRPRHILGLLAAFLTPLLLYLYLPLRGLSTTSLDGTYSNTWAGFWRHVLASDYGAFLAGNPLAVERGNAYAIELLAGQMGLVALLLGLMGWLVWSRQPRRWTLLVLVFLANLLFAISYRTADADVFYLPTIVVWLLAASAGLTALLDRLGGWLVVLGRRLRLPGPYWLWPAAAQLAVVILIMAQPLQATARTLQATSRPRTCAEALAVGRPPALNPNRAGDWSVANCGRAMLAQPLPEEATIVGLLGETTLLRYVQMVDGLRPDLQLVTADAEARRLAAVEQALTQGHAVYLTRELPGLAQHYALSAEGPLIRVWPPDTAPIGPALSQVVDVVMGEGVHLVGYDLAPVPARGARWLRLTVAWQARDAVPEELKVSARLVAPDGRVVSSVDAVPVHWAYPTTAWRPGEVIADAYDFALPAGAASEGLSPLLILYQAVDGSEVGRFQPER